MRTYAKPVEDIAFAHGERSIRSLMRSTARRLASSARKDVWGPYEKDQTACSRLAVCRAAGDCKGPRTPPTHENEKSSFGARRRNHRPEFSGADIGLHLLNYMDTAASRRKIPCHLPIPFVHGLATKPRRERYLVLVGEPGDGVFDRVDSHTDIMAQGTKAIHIAVRRPNRRLHSRACQPVIFRVGADPYPGHLLPRELGERAIVISYADRVPIFAPLQTPEME